MEIGINFDEASTCWRMNKRRVNYGSFVYICTHICKNDKQCSNKADIKIEDEQILCKYHKRKDVKDKEIPFIF